VLLRFTLHGLSNVKPDHLDPVPHGSVTLAPRICGDRIAVTIGQVASGMEYAILGLCIIVSSYTI
jgi:hypothetical protein